MDLIKRIERNQLPRRQQKVIESIVDDLEASAFLSGAQLTEKYKISFSSLTRMAQSLNYDGFPELKKEIELLYKRDFSPSLKAESFIKDTRDKSVFNIVFQSEIKNLNRLPRDLHEVDLLLSAKRINSAKRVFVVGVGYTAFIARKFSESLELLGKQTFCCTELGFSKKLEARKIQQDDVVIAFSINRELAEYKELFTELKARRAHSILFTDKKTGRLKKYADISFFATSSGLGVINCITPFLVATNILESILFSLDKHVHLAKIRNIEKSWNSLPIFLD